ncbi:MAG: DUF1367 family protein [Patescibacteria group bacterium]|nr:DUF1367 family protein [Patescibacteria group bacterium]
MSAVLLAKTLSGKLEPCDDNGRDRLAKIGAGDIVLCEIKRGRNIKFHRKLFAMLNIIFKNQEHYKSIDDLLAVAKLSTGHVHTIETRHGIVRLPASISFSSMSEDDFSDFYDRVTNWVCESVIPGLNREHLDQEVADELLEFSK